MSLVFAKVTPRLLETTVLITVVSLAASWTGASGERALELQESLTLGAVHRLLGDLGCILSLQSNLYGPSKRQIIIVDLEHWLQHSFVVDSADEACSHGLERLEGS